MLASEMGVSARHVRRIWARARSADAVPRLRMPGRPRRQATAQERDLVRRSHSGCKSGACALERVILAGAGAHMPHNLMHRLLREDGMARTNRERKKPDTGVRYERDFSDSLWHADWYMTRTRGGAESGLLPLRTTPRG